MSNYGNLDYDESWYDTPIARYFEYKSAGENGVTDHRFAQIKRNIADSPDSVEWEAWDELIDWQGGMTVKDGRDFLAQLRRAGLSERTVEEKMRIVSSFLSELLKRNVIDSNPAAYVIDETEFDADEKDKLDRSVDEIGTFLRGISDLQLRAMGTTFAKTGLRIGECYNIDLPHLYLDHDIYDSVLERHDVTLNDEVSDHPDTLYIPSEPTTGETYRGEKRESGNKRERGTPIPVDNELKRALLDWLAVRPVTTHPHPLWTSPRGVPNRISITQIGKHLTNHWAEKTGLVDDGSTGKFTSHWFRHFFTTNMEPGRGYHNRSIAPTLIKYIRGDVGTATETNGTDIMDVYSHDWGDQVRDKYLNSIYHFGIYD